MAEFHSLKICPFIFNSFSTRDENGKFANSVDLDEVAQNEPPHLDLCCLPSSLNSQYNIALTLHFLKI